MGQREDIHRNKTEWEMNGNLTPLIGDFQPEKHMALLSALMFLTLTQLLHRLLKAKGGWTLSVFSMYCPVICFYEGQQEALCCHGNLKSPCPSSQGYAMDAM